LPNESIEDHIARSCLTVKVRMLNRIVTNLYEEGLRPLSLKFGQLNVLVVAARLGTAPPEVCDFLLLDPSPLSCNVEQMSANGWLEVVPDSDR
jgi:DNA-binding MarR family transcriptional regulator